MSVTQKWDMGLRIGRRSESYSCYFLDHWKLNMTNRLIRYYILKMFFNLAVYKFMQHGRKLYVEELAKGQGYGD